MPRTITLTTEQFKQILKDYLAPPEERKQLSKEELEKVATSLNKKINVPFVSEEKEQRVLVKIVMKVDNYLYDNLPNPHFSRTFRETDFLDCGPQGELNHSVLEPYDVIFHT